MEPRIEPVTPRPALLPPQARRKLGLIVLSTDLTTQRDVGVFARPMAFANPTTPAKLRAMAPGLAAAADLILPGRALDAICDSCTAASAVIGAAIGRRHRRDRNRHRKTGDNLKPGQRPGAAAPRRAEPQAAGFRPLVQPRPGPTDRNLPP